MPKYQSRREINSRFAKIENKRLTRQAYFFFLGAILLLFILIVIGIPAMTRMAIFFGELRSSSIPSDPTDAIPPTTPQLSLPYQATASATIKLNGYTEAGATVTLYQDNVKNAETTSDNDGQFSFNSVSLNPGKNTFYLIAKDSADNESQQTQIYTIQLDNEDPVIKIDEPTDGQQFFGNAERTVTLKGSTEPGSRLTLNDRIIVVRSDGTFSNRHQLNDGDNQLVFVATDQAGNTGTTTITLKYSP